MIKLIRSTMTAAATIFLISSSAQSAKLIRVPQAVKSIQTALDMAETGDTVLVSEGTYNEAITLRDGIVLIGMSAEKTILKGKRSKPVVVGAQNAILRHFTIENGSMGILCENVFMTIEHCVVRGNKGSGIQCLLTLPVMRNNVVFRNSWSGIFCESTRSHKGAVTNNVIAENGYSGIMLSGHSEIVVENNIFYFNNQFGVYASEGSRRTRIIYNNFFGNRSSVNQFASLDRSNLFEDPAFMLSAPNEYDFWGSETPELRGRGKEGKDIGLLKRIFYNPQNEDTSDPAEKNPAPKVIKAVIQPANPQTTDSTQKNHINIQDSPDLSNETNDPQPTENR